MSRAEAPSELDLFLEQLRAQPPENQLAFASDFAARTEEMGAFLNFVNALPPELKLPIMQVHAERYASKIQGRIGFYMILDSLPFELRLAFVNHTAYRVFIENFDDLKNVLSLLPESARVALA